jgi:hypothetical protein
MADLTVVLLVLPWMQTAGQNAVTSGITPENTLFSRSKKFS